MDAWKPQDPHSLSGGTNYRAHRGIMTDETVTVTEQPVRSAVDLQIEDLTERLQRMEDSYLSRIRELEDANRSLWAEAHKAAPVPSAEDDAPTYDAAKTEAAFYSALGRKE